MECNLIILQFLTPFVDITESCKSLLDELVSFIGVEMVSVSPIAINELILVSEDEAAFLKEVKNIVPCSLFVLVNNSWDFSLLTSK